MTLRHRLLSATLVSTLVLLSGCGESDSKGTAAAGPAEVLVEVVKPERVVVKTELPGRVQALRTAEVRARVEGIIQQRLFKEGSEVAAQDLLFQIDPATLQGRAAFRCTTPDYLPLIGPLADHQAFLQRYAALGKNARKELDADCPWLDGLYLNCAHGSRGLVTAPLAAELLAAWLDDEPLPLPRSVAEACHPGRFSLRTLTRGS